MKWAHPSKIRLCKVWHWLLAHSWTNWGGRREYLEDGRYGRGSWTNPWPPLWAPVKLEGGSQKFSFRKSQGQVSASATEKGGTGMGGVHLGIRELCGVLYLQSSHLKQGGEGRGRRRRREMDVEGQPRHIPQCRPTARSPQAPDPPAPAAGRSTGGGKSTWGGCSGFTSSAVLLKGQERKASNG